MNRKNYNTSADVSELVRGERSPYHFYNIASMKLRQGKSVRKTSLLLYRLLTNCDLAKFKFFLDDNNFIDGGLKLTDDAIEKAKEKDFKIILKASKE